MAEATDMFLEYSVPSFADCSTRSTLFHDESGVRRLMRREGQKACVVPHEGAPYDRDGHSWWPPGWDPDRLVKDEGDIMELLGVPRREPHERNCP